MVSLFAIVLIFSAFAFEESQSALYSAYTCSDTWTDSGECKDHDAPITFYSSADFPLCDPDDQYDFQVYLERSTDGCWFAAATTNGAEDSSWAALKEGTTFVPNEPITIQDKVAEKAKYFDTDKVEEEYYNSVGCYYYKPDVERGEDEPYYTITSDRVALCAYDHYWHPCTGGEGGNVGKITWAKINNVYHFFQCEEDEFSFQWTDKGVDADKDGYVSLSSTSDLAVDCKDDPSPDPPFCSDVETTDDCADDIKNYHCAKCINPTSPEICGDGVDNDCSNSLDYIPDNSDSCDDNQFSCEQSVNVHLQNDEGQDIDEYGNIISSPESEPILKNYKNDKDTPFSWIETSTGGDCCGYDGLSDDFARLSTGDTRICLTNDKNLVGVDATSEQEVKEVLNWAGCEGDWCWVPAGAE